MGVGRYLFLGLCLLAKTPRYENIEEYAKAKAKIFENKNAHAIVSVDTKINEKIFGSLTNKKKTAISVNKILDKGFSMNQYPNDYCKLLYLKVLESHITTFIVAFLCFCK